MGEIADAMIGGGLCAMCGVPIECGDYGIPMYCSLSCAKDQGAGKEQVCQEDSE